MDLIGAGFSRTGTTSLKAAIEKLGVGPCINMTQLVGNPREADKWRAAQAGEATDWKELLADYSATVAWPGCSFWEPLAATFPQAKVIVTVRNPTGWYESFRDTLLPLWQVGVAGGTSGISSDYRPYFELVRLISQTTFGDKLDDADHCMRVFEQHNQAVIDAIPADRLLVFRVEEGWEPLCEFLGAAVPADDFPRLNDRDSFRRGRVRPPQQ